MAAMILPLVEWLPSSLQLLCVGIVAIFVISVLLRLLLFIKDLIPFL